MDNSIQWKEKNRISNRVFTNTTTKWILLSIIVSFIFTFPYIILGEDAIVTYHDQLDGELITYLLNAKYMFTNVTNYPELANGIPKNGMVSPAPALVLLFKIFRPYVAFVIALYIKQVFSICFSFLVFQKLTDNKWLSFGGAFIFMLLPFYTVYGLSIPGIMMVIYALMKLRDEGNPWLSYFWIFFYAVNSSLPLGGFMVVIDVGIVFLIMLCRKENAKRYFMALCVIGITYGIENISLVKQLLGLEESFVSHKSEVVYNSSKTLWDIINPEEMYYTRDYHQYYFFLIIVSAIAITYFFFRRKELLSRWKKQIDAIVISCIYIVAVMIVFTIYKSHIVTSWINQATGMMHDFNFARILWTLPPVWFIAFVASGDLILQMGKYFFVEKRIGRVLCYAFVGIPLLISLLGAAYENDIHYNIAKMIKKSYYMITWKQFFGEELYDKVEEVIGLPKEDYRVVSYGVYPSIASYNGFYCVDMYSNNYDVVYKHQFRKVIAEEIEKSDYTKKYYDDWGNRCYLIQDKTGYYCLFEKRWTPYSTEFNCNFDALRDLGCHYMISASYIIEPERYGITLLNEQPIETEDSWYYLWVYNF